MTGIIPRNFHTTTLVWWTLLLLCRWRKYWGLNRIGNLSRVTRLEKPDLTSEYAQPKTHVLPIRKSSFPYSKTAPRVTYTFSKIKWRVGPTPEKPLNNWTLGKHLALIILIFSGQLENPIWFNGCTTFPGDLQCIRSCARLWVTKMNLCSQGAPRLRSRTACPYISTFQAISITDCMLCLATSLVLTIRGLLMCVILITLDSYYQPHFTHEQSYKEVQKLAEGHMGVSSREGFGPIWIQTPVLVRNINFQAPLKICQIWMSAFLKLNNNFLQCCVGFCHTSIWLAISTYMSSPSWISLPPSTPNICF